MPVSFWTYVWRKFCGRMSFELGKTELEYDYGKNRRIDELFLELSYIKKSNYDNTNSKKIIIQNRNRKKLLFGWHKLHTW